jgi:hypothetical protein
MSTSRFCMRCVTIATYELIAACHIITKTVPGVSTKVYWKRACCTMSCLDLHGVFLAISDVHIYVYADICICDLFIAGACHIQRVGLCIYICVNICIYIYSHMHLRISVYAYTSVYTCMDMHI